MSKEFTITRKAKAASGRYSLNGAITRGARGHKTFRQTCPSYMQSFVKIRGAVLEKSADMTLCNFNKDSSLPKMSNFYQLIQIREHCY